MVRINQQPETPLSAIKFFVSKKCAKDAINELAPHLKGVAQDSHGGTWVSWCVKVEHRGYLRESGEIY